MLTFQIKLKEQREIFSEVEQGRKKTLTMSWSVTIELTLILKKTKDS